MCFAGHFPQLPRLDRVEIAAVQEIMCAAQGRKRNAKGSADIYRACYLKILCIIEKNVTTALVLYSKPIFHFPQLSMHIKVVAVFEDNMT